MTPAKRRALGVRAEHEQVGTWWNPSTPDDVRAEQKRVDTARAALATSLATKAPTGDPVQIDNAVRGWNALNAEVISYVSEDPSAFWWSRDTQVSRGQAYETQIESYRVTFGSLGAAVPPPPAAPPGSTQPGGLLAPGSMFGDVADTLKWAVIGFLAVKLLDRR
jgi:hypothetical protein